MNDRYKGKTNISKTNNGNIRLFLLDRGQKGSVIHEEGHFKNVMDTTLLAYIIKETKECESDTHSYDVMMQSKVNYFTTRSERTTFEGFAGASMGTPGSSFAWRITICVRIC